MRLIDKISPKKLRELYWKKKMSSPEIARIYHSTPEHIRLLLRKYGVRIRTKSEATKLRMGINIPKEKLRKFYLKNKLSTYEIARKFNCCQRTIYKKLLEYQIPIRSVKEAKSLIEPYTYRKDFSGNLEEKAYLMGFTKGDLHVETASDTSPTVFVNVGSTKPELIKIAEQSFSPYGHIWKGDPDKDGVVYIRCSLNRTFNFLLNKKDLIEPWILKSRKYFAAFLAGYIDAEGSFCICGGNGVAYVGSQDKTIIHQIRKKLIALGILCRPPQIKREKGTKDIRGTISNEDIWGLWIHRKDAILKLIELLTPYLKHANKRKRMEIVKKNILWRNKKYNRHQRSKYDKLYLTEGIKICQVIHIIAPSNIKKP